MHRAYSGVCVCEVVESAESSNFSNGLPSRFEILTFSAHSPSRHQAGQSSGEQQLCAQDLRLRVGQGRGAGLYEEHDAGGCHAILQLELITELLGTPSLEDMRHACAGARAHMLRRAPRPPALAALYTLSVQATHEAVHLLAQRITVVDALAHPYLEEGRLRYHSCMCKCCYSAPASARHYSPDLEPVAPQSFHDGWERKLTSVHQDACEVFYLNVITA
ncbi:unnamed protein product [Leptidea sinapis]|uniref:Uncharacterized protein n=1 Tax=Leptidea sinapis TaxID=189913 RepID=A0A5E4PSA2_9NEOP|nr:unnamed protein product [Leptidea sinapis]